MIPKMDKLAFRYNHLKHLMKACTKLRYKKHENYNNDHYQIVLPLCPQSHCS